MNIHIRTALYSRLSEIVRFCGQREILLCLSKVGHRAKSPLSKVGQRPYKGVCVHTRLSRALGQRLKKPAFGPEHARPVTAPFVTEVCL